MAHGFGGSRDSGLLPFAEAFAEAGLDVLLFDYRTFGESSGEPRQLAWPAHHREDYRAAVEFARGLGGVDPERIVLWGTSWSGGHVVYVAADDPRIAAVISQTPDLDGLRTMWEVGRYGGIGQQLRVTLAGLRDAVRMLRGREPLMIGTVAPPGRAGRDDQRGRGAGHARDRRPQLAQRDHRPRGLRRGTNRAITRMTGAVLPDPRPDRRPRLGRSAGRRASGGLAGEGLGRGARVPVPALRHLRGRVARARDRRPAPLPAAAPGRRPRGGAGRDDGAL